jgi:threonine synthase
MAFQLGCIVCDKLHDSSKYRLFCENCGGLLDITYDLNPVLNPSMVKGTCSMERYLSTLPINDPKNLVTLGEGDTPVIELPAVGQSLGLTSLYGKMEYFNPTGSFKDRGNAVQVSVLKEAGVTEVADITGGNGGLSFAAYCARAGINCHGFTNLKDPISPKLQAILLHGVNVHWTEGFRNEVEETSVKFARSIGAVSMMYSSNIYFIEGLKPIAYEIGAQMDPLPDHIVAPASNGSILQGLWRGFKEMLEDGRVERIPRLHAVQTEQVQPIVAAYSGRSWKRPDYVDSVATGVLGGSPPRLNDLIRLIKGTDGRAIAVDEDRIIFWQARLASLEGIFVEPTSAIALGALEKLIESNVISAHETVLVPFTAYGGKEPIPGVRP